MEQASFHEFHHGLEAHYGESLAFAESRKALDNLSGFVRLLREIDEESYARHSSIEDSRQSLPYKKS